MTRDLSDMVQGADGGGVDFLVAGSDVAGCDAAVEAVINEAKFIRPSADRETASDPFSVSIAPISTLFVSRSIDISFMLKSGILRNSPRTFFMTTLRSLTLDSPVRVSIGERSLYWRYASFIATSSRPD